MKLPFLDRFKKQEKNLVFSDDFYYDEFGQESNTKDKNYITDALTTWAYVANSAIADELYKTPLKLYKQTNAGEIKVESHPVLDLINNPNPEQPRWSFFWLTGMYYGTIGESLWILDKDKNPQNMSVISTAHYDIQTEGGKVSKITPKAGGNDLDLDLVIFQKIPNLYSPLRGKGVAKYIARTIEMEANADEYVLSFFENDARPSGYLMPKNRDDKLSTKSVKRMVQKMKNNFGNIKKKHKLGVLPVPFEFLNTTPKMNELRLDESDDRIKTKILAAYKVPESIVGIMDKVSANNDVSERIFAGRAVLPRLVILEDYLNNHLLPRFTNSKNLIFRFNNPVEENKAQAKIQAETDAIYVNSGIITPNEARENAGLEPLDGLDEITARNIGLMPPTQKEEKEELDDTTKFFKKMLTPKTKQINTVEELHEQKILFSDTLEGKMADEMNGYYENLRLRLIKEAEAEEKGLGNSKGLDVSDEQEEVKAIIKKYLEQAIVSQSEIEYLFNVGEANQIDITDKDVQEWIEERSEKSSKSVTNTTSDRLKDAIIGIGIGVTVITIINEVISGRKQDATTLSKTEISSGAGFGTVEVFKEIGAVGKKWVTTQSEMTCQFCAAMDGVVIPTDKNFFEKDSTFYGLDGGKFTFSYGAVASYPAHVSCYCDLVTVFDERQIPEDYRWYLEQSERRGVIAEADAKKQLALENKEKELSIKEAELKKLNKTN